MTKTLRPRGFFAGAAVLTLALVCMPGCGDDDEDQQGTPDSGTVDSGTPDSGTPDSGTPDAGPTATVDSDIAVVRFNTDGTLDTTFGTNGIAKVDFGAPSPSGAARDSLWGLATDSTNRIVLFGSRKGEGDRLDADRVVARLGANGAIDATFGTNGLNILNIGNLSDGARNGIVQADGKIVSSGYTSQTTGVGSQAANRIVLLRLDDAGKADTTFGWKGVLNSAPFQGNPPATPEWGMVEAYAVGQQSDGSYITTGYGRQASTGTVDLVSFRYSSTGVLDTTWGSNGVAQIDLIGDNDRGRNLVVLPDDRVFQAGSGTPVAGTIQAMVAIFTKNGARDTSFTADGYKLYDFQRPEQAFFGSAVSKDGNWAAAAGYRAGGTGQNDDGALAIIPVGSGGGTEFAAATPLSATENDRFWAVAFDANNKVYAAGFITEGGDNRMAVARFNTDGTLDTTFGTGGIAKINVSVGKTEEAGRGIAIQSDGKVIVAGAVEK